MSRWDSDRLLDRIVTALREEPIPEFSHLPPAPLVMNAIPSQVNGPAIMPRRTPRRWLIAGATFAMAAAILAALTMIPAAHPSLAFADVQDAVAAYASLRYHIVDFHGDKDPYVKTVAWVRGKGLHSDGPNGSEQITNLKAKRMLRLDHRSRKARLYQIYLDDADGPGDTFDQKIRKLPRDAKALGPTEFNGKKVLQFSFLSEGEYVVLVDPETKLPLRMELKIDAGRPDHTPFREVITDFVFDAPVSESLFEISIPSGYAVERCEEPPGRKPIDTRMLVVSPTKGIGAVSMGMSKEKVIAFFGAPDLIETQGRTPKASPVPGQKSGKGKTEVVFERLLYYSLGFELTVSSADGMTEFRCPSLAPIAREFLGTTDAGISLGASIEAVEKAYGPPEVRTHFRDDNLMYFHKGWSFVFGDGKLTSFSATLPMSDQIEVEDHGDGSWSERVKAAR